MILQLTLKILFIFFIVAHSKVQAQPTNKEERLSSLVYQEFDKNTKKSVKTLSFKKNPFIPQLPKVQTKTISSEVQSPEPINVVETNNDLGLEDTILPPSVTVSGIVWNTNNPQAIVDDRVVSIGDTIQNATIVSINRKGIDVLIEEKRVTIPANLDKNKGPSF